LLCYNSYKNKNLLMVISDMYYQYDTYFRRPPPFSLESRPVLGLSAFRLSAGSQNNQFLALSAPSTLRFLTFSHSLSAQLYAELSAWFSHGSGLSFNLAAIERGSGQKEQRKGLRKILRTRFLLNGRLCLCPSICARFCACVCVCVRSSA